MSGVVLEWIGYTASSIVLVSLLMSSIKKLRWINLVGALLFGFYGFMIGSIPTGFMNVGIVVIDVYYLVKMYKQKDFFKVLPIDNDFGYLKVFLDFYKEDILSFGEVDLQKIMESKEKFFILRNMTPAGIFIADEIDSKSLEIKLDYVVPQFRDFKIGNFVFTNQRDYFKSLGYERFVAISEFEEHVSYVKKMGFVEQEEHTYIKNI